MERLVLALVIALGGCTVMSPEECRTADWRQEGYFDALYYDAQPRFEQYAKVCHLQDAAAEQAYMEGWRAGAGEQQVRAGRGN